MYSKRLGRMVISKTDVDVVTGIDGPEVLLDENTSLHNISG
jgi:hypothetical protein